MKDKRYITFKYINPETEECYMTIKEEWDDIYDAPWENYKDGKVIEVRLHPKDNFLR